MSKLILIRHGQSDWNKQNLFTGFVDVNLSPEGIKEAIQAGQKIENIPIDIVFTSTLIRAQMTATLVMNGQKKQKPLLFIHASGKLKTWGADICSKEAIEKCIPVYTSWRLNERFYGKLQGMNKDEARKKFGADQVHIWRRSFDIPPPDGESLKMTMQRTLPYFKKEIVPLLEKNKTILVAAHGNSLRSIMMYLDQLSSEEIVSLEIPTGQPIIYDYHKGNFKKQDG